MRVLPEVFLDYTARSGRNRRIRSLTILRDYNEVKKEKQFHEIVDSLRKRSKGVRRMPWLPQAKKDAVSCENVRGLANTN